MLNGTVAKRPLGENDRGTGPATSVSPASSASDNPLDEDGGAEFEIDAEFRRRLTGLRRLRRRDQPQALRAAREWRRIALKALREKRIRDRHARYMQRRQMRPPSPSL